jgi:hypothetical protein
VVSNVVAAQRPDTSQIVDITYDLADADGDLCTVWVAVSGDDGATWSVPCQTFTGDWGTGVLAGVGKQIAWDAGSDMPGRVGNFRFRVCADDGKGSGAKVLVPAGWFPYQNSTWTYVPTFMIDKYEVTNDFYCRFLNSGGNDAFWNSQQDIGREGSPGDYYYSVLNGKENYPVVYVNSADAGAFAAWRSQAEGAPYRLPTEQEWEKAAAWDPTQSRYYTYAYQSDSIDSTWCNYYPAYGVPTVVGYFNGTSPRMDAQSFYGCYDMSGNVAEWTRDLSDGTGVRRGGSWGHYAFQCTCVSSSLSAQSDRDKYYGFRLVVGSP